MVGQRHRVGILGHQAALGQLIEQVRICHGGSNSKRKRAILAVCGAGRYVPRGQFCHSRASIPPSWETIPDPEPIAMPLSPATDTLSLTAAVDACTAAASPAALVRLIQQQVAFDCALLLGVGQRPVYLYDNLHHQRNADQLRIH